MPNFKQVWWLNRKDLLTTGKWLKYMKTKGYERNVHKNNYVKALGRIEDGQDIGAPQPEPINQSASGEIPGGIGECLPFIRFLYEKRDDLYQLLFGTREDGKIPRYAELSH
ncbi:MAG: hypothetical protein ACOX5W_11575 [Bacillota bacterium]|jgi:hypothetical protein